MAVFVIWPPDSKCTVFCVCIFLSHIPTCSIKHMCPAEQKTCEAIVRVFQLSSRLAQAWTSQKRSINIYTFLPHYTKYVMYIYIYIYYNHYICLCVIFKRLSSNIQKKSGHLSNPTPQTGTGSTEKKTSTSPKDNWKLLTWSKHIQKTAFLSLRIQSPCQMMIGVYNHLLSKVFRFHYYSQKVIGSLGICVTSQQVNLQKKPYEKPSWQYGIYKCIYDMGQKIEPQPNHPLELGDSTDQLFCFT